MRRRKTYFGYIELMTALEGNKNPALIQGIVVNALDSWRVKKIDNRGLSAIFTKVAENISKI